MYDLVNSEYIKFNYSLIPQKIIKDYKLNEIVDNGFVCTKINRV